VDGFEARIAAIKESIDTHNLRVAELMAALGQIEVLRDEILAGNNDDED
jgi:hypothetical protein